MIMDKSFGTILWSRSPEKVWPLASITKLMSAIVFLETIEGNVSVFEDEYVMTKKDAVDGTVYIYQGEEVKIGDLFNLSLVGSINSATRALLHSIGLTDEEAVDKMNKLARSRGFWNTEFSGVTGLNHNNVTTAKEAAWIIKEALSYEIIQETLIKDSYTLVTDVGRSVKVLNTNKLLGGDLTIEGGKTGYIAESGYNFAVSVKNDNEDLVIIVVLGTEEPSLRFSETEFLANWVFNNYEWK
jgi:D-alanyl-D-alanine carboxypeptidase